MNGFSLNALHRSQSLWNALPAAAKELHTQLSAGTRTHLSHIIVHFELNVI